VKTFTREYCIDGTVSRFEVIDMIIRSKAPATEYRRDVVVPVGSVQLEGELIVPDGASGIVVFAHGSGSSRNSPRNKYVAGVIRDSGLGTLLFDLLTPQEESVDAYTGEYRFDIRMLADRLIAAARWLKGGNETKHLEIGLFGASTGGAAALVAAAELGKTAGAVVSRGGRPDLAGDALAHVRSPVLLIVGGDDDVVIELNREAFARLHCTKELMIVPGATHLFEEPGTLESVARLSAGWFERYLPPEAAAERRISAGSA
jgi:putative phosphoribosyl transferase